MFSGCREISTQTADRRDNRRPDPLDPTHSQHDSTVSNNIETEGSGSERLRSGSEVTVRPLRRNRRRGWWILGGLLLLVVLLVAVASNSSSEPDGLGVEVDTAVVRTIVETVTAPGVIRPATEVVIASEVSGEVVYLGVREGERVEKGQLLVRINPDAIRAEQEQVRAQILAARSAEASARASSLRASSEYERAVRLREKDLITEQEFERLKSQAEIAETEREAAGYRVEQAQAALQQVRESLKKTAIHAPISGTITRLSIRAGEKVVGAIQMTGTEIMTISDLSEIEARVDVVETDVVGIDPGEEAIVEIDAFPGERFRALVSHVANAPTASMIGSGSEMTSFEVRLSILDPDARIRPGMSATAMITTARKEGVLTVPIQAVTIRVDESDDESDDQRGVEDLRLTTTGGIDRPDPVVFVLEGRRAIARPVQTGLRDDRYIEILSGIAPGVPVVSGPYRLISRDLESGDEVFVRRDGEKQDE